MTRFLKSRFPKLRPSPTSEALLWDRLDRCGIAFRAPMADLIDRYGAKPAIWSDQLDICILHDADPFIAGLAHPPAFQFSQDTDLLQPPSALFCAVQASPDHRINYAKAIAALKPHFGEGTVGTAANTASRSWQFGHATLSCTVWPPEAQSPARNTRHEIFPETRTEASIWMSPAYRTHPPPDLLAACACPALLPCPALPPKRLIAVGALTYDWPAEIEELPCGLYLSESGDSLLKQTRTGLIDILPRDWMRQIALARITGGRGGQEAIVTIEYSPSGQPDLPPQTMTLCEIYGDPNALDAFANDLAQRLDLPVDIYEGPQD
ncbi:MAG: hypothetical protein AAGA08_11150 [Pseudomonadota bacterium]